MGECMVLMELNVDTYTHYYYYADKLPYSAIMATPLILLCCLPTIESIKKVKYSLMPSPFLHPLSF